MILIKKIKDSNAVKFIINIAGYVKFQIIFLTICMLVLSYISVKFASVSKIVLDAATVLDKRNMLSAGIVQLAILLLIQLTVQIFCTVVNLRTEVSLKNRIQKDFFSDLLGKQYMSFSKYHTGELLNRLDGDVGIVTQTVISILPNMLGFLSRIILGFLFLYRLDRDFALIFLVIGPLMMIVAKEYSRRVKPLHKQCRQTHGKTQSFILDVLRGILVVKSFGVYSTVKDALSVLQKDNFKVVMKRGYMSLLANILFYISLTAGYYFAVAWCAYKISAGIMTIGTFTAVLQLVGQVQAPFRELASAVPQFFAMTASAERICELTEMPNDFVGETDVDEKKMYDSMKSVFLENVSFSYDGEPVLSKASAVIPKNTVVAVSGISGIGKSTMLKLILGILAPQEGTVGIRLYDGTCKPVNASMRKFFAYVPQGNWLISGTVRDNICFMDDCADEERMLKAASDACAYEFISELPEGFNTRLGENGYGLSEGQRQRLAVARALYSRAPILLLDEATSALDENTEKNMLENIKSLSDRTCIIVSHKDCACRISDYIINIENGNILLTPVNKKGVVQNS